MAIKIFEAAKGNAPATGMQKSVAPTRPAPPDAVSTIRKPTAQSYGENGPKNNQSVLRPGEFMESDLGKSMRAAVDDDGVLQTIIDGKGHGDVEASAVADLQRKIDITQYPTTHGTRQRNLPAGTFDALPKKLGASPDADYLARRAAELKQGR